MPRNTRFISTREAASQMGITRVTLHAHLKNERIPGALKVGDRWVIPLPIRLKPGSRGPASLWEQCGGLLATDGMQVHYSSNTPHWNTPKHIVGLVEQVLGTIDLDPCSDELERPNIPAQNHFTAAEDGLRQKWHGTVYMNPPYGRSIVQWVEHLCQEFAEGRTSEAIALVPSRTDTKWFQLFAPFAKCFIHGRLRFGGAENTAPFPSVAVYMGSKTSLFADIFADTGTISLRSLRE